MKKYTQIISVLVVFTLLVIAKKSLTGGEQVSLNGGEAPVPSQTPLPAATTTPTLQTSTPAPSPQGKYKNGTYTGTIADAYYGFVQVQAIVSGGQITDVRFLQYPNDNGTSRSINSQAMPYLIQEAIQAQSANVNTVSGASATSGAFQQSLQSALAQAV